MWVLCHNGLTYPEAAVITAWKSEIIAGTDGWTHVADPTHAKPHRQTTHTHQITLRQLVGHFSNNGEPVR